jgi:hypothetical protein
MPGKLSWVVTRRLPMLPLPWEGWSEGFIHEDAGGDGATDVRSSSVLCLITLFRNWFHFGQLVGQIFVNL